MMRRSLALDAPPVSHTTPGALASSHPVSRAGSPRRLSSLALTAALTLTLAGCHLRDTSGEPAPGPDVPRPEQVLDFSSLYAQNCAACHGAHGDHGAATNLANPEYEAWIDDNSLRNILTHGEPGVLMPAFAKSAGGELTDQQIDVLVRGMRQTWPPRANMQGAPPYHPTLTPNPTHGQAVYNAACARCHGPTGNHPGPAGSILDGTFLALINPQTVRSTIVPGRPDLGQPDFRNDIPNHPLTDADVTDVSAWLLTQRPAHPGHPYPLAPNTQPTSDRPGEQQPLSELNPRH